LLGKKRKLLQWRTAEIKLMGDGKKEIVANDMRLSDFIELG